MHVCLYNSCQGQIAKNLKESIIIIIIIISSSSSSSSSSK